jgi:transposase
MAMGHREEERQAPLFVPHSEIPRGPGHVFYDRLAGLLAKHGFDAFVEERCARFYAARMGRPSIPPGVYFRMLMIGYFEGLDSERGIAWRCQDSFSLRRFLGFGPTEDTPDHSTLCKLRQALDLETHREVFGWVLALLAREKVLRGKTLGVDATTLEANAALRSIVRRDTGESYSEYLDGLAKASGIATPTRQDRKKLDKKRPGKGNNAEWKSPTDEDARITKMKDGRTHLAHKAEHAVDLESGAVVGVTLQPADRGDAESLYTTMEEANNQLKEATGQAADEVVADKGYHSNDTVSTLTELEQRTYFSEPERPRRRWKGQTEVRDAVYANRERIARPKGQRLRKRRGELVERSFAHCLESGGMRRVHLRGHDNILKRYLVHVAAFNIGLLLRQMLGCGTPRELANRLARAFARLCGDLGSVVQALIRIVHRSNDDRWTCEHRDSSLGHWAAAA